MIPTSVNLINFKHIIQFLYTGWKGHSVIFSLFLTVDWFRRRGHGVWHWIWTWTFDWHWERDGKRDRDRGRGKKIWNVVNLPTTARTRLIMTKIIQNKPFCHFFIFSETYNPHIYPPLQYHVRLTCKYHFKFQIIYQMFPVCSVKNWRES